MSSISEIYNTMLQVYADGFDEFQQDLFAEISKRVSIPSDKPLEGESQENITIDDLETKPDRQSNQIQEKQMQGEQMQGEQMQGRQSMEEVSQEMAQEEPQGLVQGGEVNGKKGIDTNKAELKKGDFVLSNKANKNIVKELVKNLGIAHESDLDDGNVEVKLTDGEWIIPREMRPQAEQFLQENYDSSLEQLNKGKLVQKLQTGGQVRGAQQQQQPTIQQPTIQLFYPGEPQWATQHQYYSEQGIDFRNPTEWGRARTKGQFTQGSLDRLNHNLTAQKDIITPLKKLIPEGGYESTRVPMKKIENDPETSKYIGTVKRGIADNILYVKEMYPGEPYIEQLKMFFGDDYKKYIDADPSEIRDAIDNVPSLSIEQIKDGIWNIR